MKIKTIANHQCHRSSLPSSSSRLLSLPSPPSSLPTVIIIAISHHYHHHHCHCHCHHHHQTSSPKIIIIITKRCHRHQQPLPKLSIIITITQHYQDQSSPSLLSSSTFPSDIIANNHITISHHLYLSFIHYCMDSLP